MHLQCYELEGTAIRREKSGLNYEREFKIFHSYCAQISWNIAIRNGTFHRLANNMMNIFVFFSLAFRGGGSFVGNFSSR